MIWYRVYHFGSFGHADHHVMPDRDTTCFPYADPSDCMWLVPKGVGDWGCDE